MPTRLHALLITAVASATCVAPAVAQCPDGSPPPCEVPVRTTARRLEPPPEAKRSRSFLILPFRNVTRSAEHEWLVEGSPAMLADVLGQWQELSVVPPERLYPALQRHGLAAGAVMDEARVRRVAEETGGWTAVTGEFLATGGRMRVSARAYDVVSNRIVVQAVEQVQPSEDVRAAYERLAAKLLQRAGLEGGAVSLTGATTQSLDAYQAYLRGVAHTNRSEFRQAREAFLEAIRRDSTFAQAYARLAEASVVDLEALYNPRSLGYVYAERAVQFAGHLPPRDQRLVRVINAFYHGQFGAARAELEQLVAVDSNDVEALEWLAGLELWDSMLMTEGGRERRRGSLNASARLAKRVLSLEPARHRYYTLFVYSYALAAGYMTGALPGYRREAGSPREMFTRLPDRFYVAVLRDTIELVPLDVVGSGLTTDSLVAVRQRALPIARAWVERWLAVGPTEAEAHLWASRIYELEGRFDDALRTVMRAESLGVESGWDNPRSRRMVLLARLGRYAEAAHIADSLAAAGAFDAQGLIAIPSMWESVSWGMHLLLLGGDVRRADAVLGGFLAAIGAAGGPALAGMGRFVLCSSGGTRLFSQVTVPAAIRLEAVRGALPHLDRLAPAGSLARCLPQLLRTADRSAEPPARVQLARLATDAALALADGGRMDLAFELASVGGADSVQAARLGNADWYQARIHAQREAGLAAQRRFRPVSATVSDSAASFEWQVLGTEAMTWNRAESRADEIEHGWETELDVLETRYAVTIHQHKAPGSSPRSGPPLQLVTSASERQVENVTVEGSPPMRDALVLVQPTPGGFQVQLRNPALVSALRRERPATVRFRLLPCIDDPAIKCVDEPVTVVYP